MAQAVVGSNPTPRTRQAVVGAGRSLREDVSAATSEVRIRLPAVPLVVR